MSVKNTELHKLLDDGAHMLTSWMPAELRTLLDGGAQLIDSWLERNQLTDALSATATIALFIMGLFMLGTMLESFTASTKK